MMLRWLRRRQEGRRLAQADAEALIVRLPNLGSIAPFPRDKYSACSSAEPKPGLFDCAVKIVLNFLGQCL